MNKQSLPSATDLTITD